MRRREFITLIGGAAVAWPFGANAEQVGATVIGFLNSASPELFEDRLRAFREGLAKNGVVEGQDVKIEYRWADGKYDRHNQPRGGIGPTRSVRRRSDLRRRRRSGKDRWWAAGAGPLNL